MSNPARGRPDSSRGQTIVIPGQNFDAPRMCRRRQGTIRMRIPVFISFCFRCSFVSADFCKISYQVQVVVGRIFTVAKGTSEGICVYSIGARSDVLKPCTFLWR